MFKSDEMVTKTILITPAIAQTMLDTNISNNRNIKQSWVNTLADMIQRGTFKLTAQGIAFAKDGTLIDGQHRLRAIIKADTPCEMRVTFGCANDSFDVLDIGYRRSARDVAVINGGEAWERDLKLISSFGELIKRRNSYLYKSLTPGDMFNIIRNNSNIARVFYGCCISRKMVNTTKAITGALLEALVVTKDVESVYNFRDAWEFKSVIDDHKYATNIVHSFRNRLAMNKAKHISIEGGKTYNTTQNVFSVFVSGNHNAKISKNTLVDRYAVDIQDFINGKYDAYFKNVYVDSDGVRFG